LSTIFREVAPSRPSDRGVHEFAAQGWEPKNMKFSGGLQGASAKGGR